MEKVQREDRKPLYGEVEKRKRRISKAERETGVPERDKSKEWGRIGDVSTLQQKDCRRGRG